MYGERQSVEESVGCAVYIFEWDLTFYVQFGEAVQPKFPISSPLHRKW